MCSFSRMQSSTAPNPQCPTQLFPPLSRAVQGAGPHPHRQLTATSSEGARSHVTPCSMAKCCPEVAESLGRVTGIPKETSGQGAVCTPRSCDQQEQASLAPAETLHARGLTAHVTLWRAELFSSPQSKQVIRLSAHGQTLPPGPLKDREELRTSFLRTVVPQVSTMYPILTGMAQRKRKGKCFCQI